MEKVKKLKVSGIFINPVVFVLKFGAGVKSRYGFGSTKMIRLLAVPAPQHCFSLSFN
jgi:hypothetical protein